MVKLFFGLPGCGKTTLMTYFALDAVRRGKYENVYHNVRSLCVPGATYIDNECIGKYNLEKCLLLIDEASLFADSRDYKNFAKDKLQYFLMHRHYFADIYLFTQQWDGIDRKIRVITDRVYYVFKTPIFGHWFTKYYRIPYGIIIPDKKHQGEKLGEIIQGYCKPNLLIRIFCPRVFRPSLYKYFNSFDRDELEPLPQKYFPYGSEPPEDKKEDSLLSKLNQNKEV